jgi:hypothetical protein
MPRFDPAPATSLLFIKTLRTDLVAETKEPETLLPTPAIATLLLFRLPTQTKGFRIALFLGFRVRSSRLIKGSNPSMLFSRI